MSKQAFLALFLASISLFTTSPVFAKRIALVIGNDDYANVSKLQKAVNDSKAVADTLRDIGFQVTHHMNLKNREMNRTIFRDFLSEIKKGDEVLFYFAGHGIALRNRNYLLATDIPKIKPGNEQFVITEAIAVDLILSSFKERAGEVNILILDACRDNPFPRKGTRSLGATRGLIDSKNPKGSFVMFSAGAGQAALDRLDDDDPHPNSVYTRKLIPLLKSPGIKLTDMAKRLRNEVEALALKVNHNQYPSYYDETRGDFFFVPKVKKKAPAPTVVNQEDALWKTIENSKNVSDFEFFLSKFPNGKYRAVAELKLHKLHSKQKKKRAELDQKNIGRTKKEISSSQKVNKTEKNSSQKLALKLPIMKKQQSRHYKPGDTFKDCDDCPEMVVVPPGDFMMGSPKSEKKRDEYEGPRHKVTIPAKFAVGKFEITRAQFATFVNETGHDMGNKCWAYENKEWKEPSNRSYENPGIIQDDTHPVVCVNWNDAKAYVRWLSHKTKKKYRLLSEAEWEYVARAKTDTPFWWGRSISTSQANYYDNYTYNGSKVKYRKKTVPVDSFEVNDFGLYNVHGNVWEWVEDCWHNSYHGAPKDGTAWTKGGECNRRVLRGGSWGRDPRDLRSANRNWHGSDFRDDVIGFRVSRTLVAQVR